MKAKVLIDGLNHNGEELKKGKTVELPWQIINNWSIRGWVKPIEDGEDDEVQPKTDTTANTGTGNIGRNKNSVKDTHK